MVQTRNLLSYYHHYYNQHPIDAIALKCLYVNIKKFTEKSEKPILLYILT